MSDIDYGCNADNPLDAIAVMLDSAPQAERVVRELEGLGFKIVRKMGDDEPRCPECGAAEPDWDGRHAIPDWDEGLRAEVERLRADNDRMREALELIAGQSTQKLEAMQAKAALTNIGPNT